jgi:hypothetical protein
MKAQRLRHSIEVPMNCPDPRDDLIIQLRLLRAADRRVISQEEGFTPEYYGALIVALAKSPRVKQLARAYQQKNGESK